jgi:hypothetical protein
MKNEDGMRWKREEDERNAGAALDFGLKIPNPYHSPIRFQHSLPF